MQLGLSPSFTFSTLRFSTKTAEFLVVPLAYISETKMVLSNKAILFSTLWCFLLIYYLSYSDSYVFCVFWNSSLTVASPIWPILQSMSLPVKASQNNFHTRGFSPKYTFFFFFKCEDGWIIASEIKTECYNPGNFQNIELLLMAMSSSTCCPCCLLPSLLPSGCQIQYLFYHPSS